MSYDQFSARLKPSVASATKIDGVPTFLLGNSLTLFYKKGVYIAQPFIKYFSLRSLLYITHTTPTKYLLFQTGV